jgi:hypothetical protein
VDLSFARMDRDMAVTALPTDLAVLMVGVAARQAASPTARAQARLARGVRRDGLLAPADGAFHRAAAIALTRRQGM